MKAKKEKKNATMRPDRSSQPSGKTDTSRWESLLAGGKSNGAAAAPVKLTLGRRASVSTLLPSEQAAGPLATAGTQVSNGHSAARPENTKKLKIGKGRGVSATAVGYGGPSNWEKLLNVPVSPATTTNVNAAGLPAAAAAATTHASTTKPNKGKNKKKRSRPGASRENGAVPLDFFAGTQAARSAAAAAARSQGADSAGQKNGVVRKASGSGGSAAAPGAQDNEGSDHGGKKRKRGRTNLNGGRGEDSGGDGGAHRKKWPKPNSLNLAFQAKKAAELENQKEKGSTAGGVGRGRGKGKAQVLTSAEQAQYVGLDCEMVGVGPGGCRSALARCCMIDWEGNVM